MDIDVGPIFRAMLRHKVKFGLIIVEIALTVAIMANSASMILQARRDLRIPSGFDDENLVSVVGRPLDRSLTDQTRINEMLREDREKVRAMPGVRAVVNTYMVPWSSYSMSTNLVQAEGGSGEFLRVQMYSTDEGLLDALQVSLIEGRMFTTEEIDESTRRLYAAEMSERKPDGTLKITFDTDVIVSEAFARRAFGEPPWVGRTFVESDGSRSRVTGVIDHFYKPYIDKHSPVSGYVSFHPYRSANPHVTARFLVRTEPGRAAEVADALPARLFRPDLPREIKAKTISYIHTMYFGPQRLVAGSMAVVNVLLVLVTALGVAGLTSFSVTERTRQIGTRRALGATAGVIVRYFLIETSLVTSTGLALGAVFAVALNLAVTSMIEGQAKLDFAFLVFSMVLLWFVGLVSAISPAMRGARISPAVATRNI
ncbi:ABC transporter permease [Pendulispora rubella]|uniref:ABC transporter permease n=1 Tax=Pendulispora rubella TaxID=2741070 RepID=A0ABZ2LBL8_9BACT